MLTRLRRFARRCMCEFWHPYPYTGRLDEWNAHGERYEWLCFRCPHCCKRRYLGGRIGSSQHRFVMWLWRNDPRR